MKYSLIFFDADDTLFDFTKSQEIAFKNAVAHFKINFHTDILYSDYKKINKELWNNLEQGLVSLENLRILRFKKIYGTYNFISEPPTLWTMILLWTILYNIAIIILLIIKYLP